MALESSLTSQTFDTPAQALSPLRTRLGRLFSKTSAHATHTSAAAGHHVKTHTNRRPAGHRITSCETFDAQWRNKPTAQTRLAAANKLNQTLHTTIFNEHGMATVNLAKDMNTVINHVREKVGAVRLVVGGQRGPDCLDAGSHAFIWDPYYNLGLQRAQPEDFSINTDLTANPDLWGDVADAATMNRLADACFDAILLEALPIEAISALGDKTAEDIAYEHHYLQAGIAQGSPFSSVVKSATRYNRSRQGLATWGHLARVLAPGGTLIAQCSGEQRLDRNTVADTICAAQDHGLVLQQVTLMKSAMTPGYSYTSVTLGPDLKRATVTVTRDGLLGTRTHQAQGEWAWCNDTAMPHFNRLLAMTRTDGIAHDVFDNLALTFSKTGPAVRTTNPSNPR